MSELKPVGLAVLRAAGRGEVYLSRSFRSEASRHPDDCWLQPPGERRRKVSGVAWPLLEAGLLRAGPPENSGSYAKRPVVLTDEGRRVLAEDGDAP